MESGGVLVRNVGRVSTTRSVLSELRIGSKLRLELSVITEFFATRLEGLNLQECSWNIGWEVQEGNPGATNPAVETAEVSFLSSSSSFIQAHIIAPARAGKYQLQISCTPPPATDFTLLEFASSQYFHSEFLILPLISDEIIISTQPLRPKPTLFCYRDVHFPLTVSCSSVSEGSTECEPHSAPSSSSTFQYIRIQEEYGAQIGSHLWDSCIILTRFLHSSRVLEKMLPPISTSTSTSAPKPANSEGRIAVELGAGLGLCGIYLAKYSHIQFKHVVITDTSKLLAHIGVNISNNMCENAVTKCIDFTEGNDAVGCIDSIGLGILDKIFEQRIDLILAADVMYDEKITKSFLQTVKKIILLEKQKHCDSDSEMWISCPLIVAQKVRGDKDKEYFESLIKISLSQSESENENSGATTGTSKNPQLETSYELLYTEADVYVWSLQFIATVGRDFSSF